MKHKYILLFVILVLALTFAGCGQQAQKEPPVMVPPTLADNPIPEEPKKEDTFQPSEPTKIRPMLISFLKSVICAVPLQIFPGMDVRFHPR